MWGGRCVLVIEEKLTSMNLEFHTVTHIGKVRKNNQDYLDVNLEGQFAVIADGVGGRHYGEVASKIAVESAMDYLQKNTTNKSNLVGTELSNCIRIANADIIKAQKQDERYKKMGTTMVCFALKGEMLFFSWVGDSRLYLYKASHDMLLQLTQDHALKPEKFNKNATHKMRKNAKNVITKMVGGAMQLKPSSRSSILSSGDILLACTDGLSDMVDHDFIHEQLRLVGSEMNIKECSETLLDKALDVGGTDNISFITAKVK